MSSAFILPLQISHKPFKLSSNRCPRLVSIPARNRPHFQQVRPPSCAIEPGERESSQSPTPRAVRTNRVLLTVVYASFLIYAVFFAPGDWHDSYELQKLLDLDFERSNDAFVALIGLSIVTTFNYIGSFNAGISRQTRPSSPFTILATFLGYFAVGPYLIFRKYVPKVSRDEILAQPVTIRMIEAPWFSIPFVILSLGAYAYAFGSFEPGGEIIHDLLFYSSFANLLRISRTDAFVNIVCIDFVIRTFLLWGPLTEDMRRRGWFEQDNVGVSTLTALTILCTPGLGPALYLSTKSELPTEEQIRDSS